jgi:hypothetical protein
MQTLARKDTPRQAPDPATVQAVVARFAAGMRDPGRVTIALIAAHFRCSWREAERLLARILHRQEDRP